MSTALDPMRRWLGLGSSQSSQRDVSESPVAGPEATDAVDGLHYRTRRALGIATVVAGGVAMSHQPLADALAVTHGHGVLGAGHAVLVWPTPLAQPVLAGVGAFILLIIGVDTRGWRQVTWRQRWYLLASTIAAILGAVPMVLVCVVAVAVIAVAMMIGMLIFLGLLILLIVARRR